MTKVFKILGRILGISLEWILILITVFAFVIRTSTVQTYIAQKATEYLSKELQTTIRIERVSIVFIDRIAVDGILVLDKNNDTIASIKTLYGSLRDLSLKKKYIKLDEVELEGGTVHVSREKEKGIYNYQFIIDFFATEKVKKGEKPFDVTLDKLILSSVDVKYDDNRKGYSTYGVDFDHLDLKDVSLSIFNFTSRSGVITAEIAEMEAKEKSGFVIDNLSTIVSASQTGLKFKNLLIETPYSKISSPKLYLLMNDLEDLQTFEDSVSFDAYIAPSAVSLKDISYFASALEGMDQMVAVSGKVTRKVENLKITNLNLKTGEKTVLQGDFNLPDFKNIEKSFFHETITYAYISLDDLKAIKMPVSSKEKYLTFDKYLERLGHFQIKDFRMDGFYHEFVVKSDFFKTELGIFHVDNGIKFTENPTNNSFYFEKSMASSYDVKIENFQLDKFLDDKNFGLVDGTLFLSGEVFSLNDIQFSLIEGNINRFDYMDYSYEDIYVKEGSFIDQKFIAKVEVKDDNLNLVYDGFIDFKGNQHMVFSVDLTKAILDNLNITTKDSTSLTSNFKVNFYGKTANNMSGEIIMDGILYKEGNREIQIPSLKVQVSRGKIEDEFWISSDMATVNLRGKIDFNTLISNFTDQFQKVFPSIIAEKRAKTTKPKSTSHFTYSVITNELNDFLSIFVPDLRVAPGTTMDGKYDGRTEDFSMVLVSPNIVYQDLQFKGVNLVQNLNSTTISANYNVDHFIYNDSIQLDQVHFVTTGQQNVLSSTLSWNQNGTNNSLIDWETNIVSNNNLNFTLRPSYFSINEQRWEIINQSYISLAESKIQVDNFKVQRNKQFISIDGLISRNDEDKLNFKINDIDLKEIGALIGSDIEMSGEMNGWGNISNPYTNLLFIGDAAINNLYINKQEVGDVSFQSQWNKSTESVGLTGDLVYRGNETFKFDGSYYTKREKDNLDFNLLFDHTDIKFTNAFMDPDVINNIRGLLQGSLKVTGTPESPSLEGEVELISGNAKIEILGANFGLDGKISADQYGFYIDNMPVTDEEGNSGMMVGSIYHEQYKDWNFDLQFELMNSSSFGFSPFSNFGTSQSDKFLVLNTQYKEGEYYYGKAYVSGSANIFGYSDNIEITVDFETKKGTTINFPMYGVSELSEEEKFIVFKPKDGDIAIVPPKIDFTGVDLNLNFRVTPDAKLKIIFNEQLGDEITATGSGIMSMQLDNLGDLSMDGTFRVKDGMYNFAMGPIKQPFHIEEGGTISWTGDPYRATLNLKTYYEVNANLAEISPDQFGSSSSGSNQKILCYLELTESLLKPTIRFDIKAPKADEAGKALIARITSDEDELNRQFFSLLLWKRFQPLKGSTAAGGSAALDLVSNQINAMLSQVSKDYKLNVNLDADNLTGENSLEFGVSKGFLDDRLIFTGSFGVENAATNSQQPQSALIGDVSLEYLLNEAGTVRVTVFNESNDYSIIQDKQGGAFTQGVGLNYQEDFDNMENFKLVQYFLDLFRKDENKKYPIKRKKRQSKVPPLEDGTKLMVLPEDELKKS